MQQQWHLRRFLLLLLFHPLLRLRFLKCCFFYCRTDQYCNVLMRICGQIYTEMITLLCNIIVWNGKQSTVQSKINSHCSECPSGQVRILFQIIMMIIWHSGIWHAIQSQFFCLNYFCSVQVQQQAQFAYQMYVCSSGRWRNSNEDAHCEVRTFEKPRKLVYKSWKCTSNMNTTFRQHQLKTFITW